MTNTPKYEKIVKIKTYTPGFTYYSSKTYDHA